METILFKKIDSSQVALQVEYLYQTYCTFLWALFCKTNNSISSAKIFACCKDILDNIMATYSFKWCLLFLLPRCMSFVEEKFSQTFLGIKIKIIFKIKEKFGGIKYSINACIEPKIRFFKYSSTLTLKYIIIYNRDYGVVYINYIDVPETIIGSYKLRKMFTQ